MKALGVYLAALWDVVLGRVNRLPPVQKCVCTIVSSSLYGNTPREAGSTSSRPRKLVSASSASLSSLLATSSPPQEASAAKTTGPASATGSAGTYFGALSAAVDLAAAVFFFVFFFLAADAFTSPADWGAGRANKWMRPRTSARSTTAAAIHSMLARPEPAIGNGRPLACLWSSAATDRAGSGERGGRGQWALLLPTAREEETLP
eukprot:CAMPEP_0117671536 /NCGR_PEP_ID=MMETSP0804-20121206/13388_1 /TAXON_ID=1074897 /ORGANISM="Tetraselmis astigmatica, Strain CCMP880" /LENGTH=204 /DNA_ID=CAMNT_0005480007 /DNA_START=579 /DNA_END=1194 /DNA_ORIENTATION=+